MTTKSAATTVHVKCDVTMLIMLITLLVSLYAKSKLITISGKLIIHKC